MPRPTAAQLAYGSATVVLSALALLLLTGATHIVAVAAIGVGSMVLGLTVAVAVPIGRAARAAKTAGAARSLSASHRAAAGRTTSGASADGLTTRVRTSREHSLRR
ncbi:hypothetical protein [Streptomyces albipurpureus]|uniref:Uncharacterized protein n=1 Tax=Streptomyces albipurpureus TaxID=2897419 RepID=A0ABT0UUI9_9ACTN|nr:hypothetical protein [Streptomyces sp. CWNU-1]MCM2392242.1 hypothetical protein [Streptomyces sp. CWNU-1]